MMENRNFGSKLYRKIKKKMPFYQRIWNILRGKKDFNYKWEVVGETTKWI